MSAGCLASVWHVKLGSGRNNIACSQRPASRQIARKACSLAKSRKLYLGLDFGTSGARAICIDGRLICLYLQVDMDSSSDLLMCADVGNVIHDTRTDYHYTGLSGWCCAWERLA